MNEHSKRLSESNLKMAVKKKWITQDEYDEIVGGNE